MAQTWQQEVQESQGIQGLPADATVDGAAISGATAGDVAAGDVAVGAATAGNAAIGNGVIGDVTVSGPAVDDATIGNGAINDAAIGNVVSGDAAFDSPAVGDAAIGSVAISNAAIGNAPISDAAISDAIVGEQTTAISHSGASPNLAGVAAVRDGATAGHAVAQSVARAISRHRTSISIVSLALAVIALAIVEGLILRSNTADHIVEMRIILAAGAQWSALVPAAHAIAVCFSAVVAVPVITVLLAVIWAVTRSAGQMLRGLAMAALPMAVIGLIKTIVDRTRPSTARGALMPDPSFPSGHTACSVVVVSLALFMLHVIDARIMDSCRRTGLAASEPRANQVDVHQANVVNQADVVNQVAAIPAISATSAAAGTPRTAGAPVTESANVPPQSPQSPFAWRILRRVLTVILIIVPFVVALSRVIYGVHYPTDVCTSLVLTPVLVWCVYRLCDPAR